MSFKIKTIVFDSYFERKFEDYKKKLSQKELEKLKGGLKNYWVFSISYSDRLLFRFLNKDKVFFIDIGDHRIYK